MKGGHVFFAKGSHTYVKSISGSTSDISEVLTQLSLKSPIINKEAEGNSHIFMCHNVATFDSYQVWLHTVSFCPQH